MSKKLNWLLAGAALTLVAGASVAAEHKKDDAPAERRVERRVIVHGGPGARVHVYRGPEAHADHIRDILQLKPNQEAALKAYLEATKPDHDRSVRVERKSEMTTPERLDLIEKRMAERDADMKRRHDATRAFYAQLDPAQKKAFDAMPMFVGGPGHMAMMGPGPMMHRMPLPPMPPAPPAPPEPRD